MLAAFVIAAALMPPAPVPWIVPDNSPIKVKPAPLDVHEAAGPAGAAATTCCGAWSRA